MTIDHPEDRAVLADWLEQSDALGALGWSAEGIATPLRVVREGPSAGFLARVVAGKVVEDLHLIAGRASTPEPIRTIIRRIYGS